VLGALLPTFRFPALYAIIVSMSEQGMDERQPPERQPIRVLIVDNERDHAQVMAEALERVGYECMTATSGPEGARRIEDGYFDIVITDLVMNDVDGMEILRRAKEKLDLCEVIVVTGHASVPKAVEAMQQGAANFLEKPLNIGRLRAVTEKAAEAVRLKQKNLELRQRLDERFGYEGIVYSSQKMKHVIERIKRIAPTDATVMIRGETGTGKELVAQAIHHNSPRKNKPYVAVNTGAIAEHLVESELFGHVKGAFTDAVSDRVGKFEYANGGTLFLDEVGDMPPPTQIKLLRALEQREITRVGDNKPIKVNVRVVSATNRDLEQMVREGTFREDLYFRLKVVTLDIPPLRERKDDIIPLMDHFRKDLAREHSKKVRGFTTSVTRRFLGYNWPGNVRELRNMVNSMVVLDIDGVLDYDDLPSELMDVEEAAVPLSVSGDGAAIPTGPSELIGRSMDDIERWAIEQTLALHNGNREETAKALGIGARTLYRKLEKYREEDEAAARQNHI
jgi:two-component system response regulator HydG